jgi:hypothetical protein
LLPDLSIWGPQLGRWITKRCNSLLKMKQYFRLSLKNLLAYDERERERETRLGSSMYLMPVVIREFHNERRLKFWILFQVCKGHSFPKDEYFVLNTVSCLTHICVTNRAVLFILCLAFSVPLFLLTFHLSFTKANYAGNWRLFLSACCCEMVFAFSHPLHWIFICLGSSFCFLVLKPG